MVKAMKEIIKSEVSELNNTLDFTAPFYDSLSAALNDPTVAEKATAVRSHAEAHAEAYTKLMEKLGEPKRFRFDVHYSIDEEKFVCIECTTA